MRISDIVSIENSLPWQENVLMVSEASNMLASVRIQMEAV